ncbi:hypothetical protein JCM10908_007290 [Rhodotorula pacifica]|uniref:uncharacterized protein n=1 Tax=Rhodotorula pacifica TaxID=1495444 RepID=UPI00316F7D39
MSRCISLVLAVLLLADEICGFWRLPCQNGALVVQRADPLTIPGGISGHVHTISGGSGFNLDMTFEDARASRCTSCQVKQDLSNYWTPALYFAHANGSFTLVDQGGLLIYYLPHRNAADKGPVKAFPDGFRMLAGNPYKRSFDGSEMARAIGINCIGGRQKPTKKHEFPTENCPDAMRMEIMFPSCWDGKNLDSANHQSHVAWPIGDEHGPCPDGFPVRIETLFYEVWWTTDPWKDRWKEAKNTSQPFVFSTGDPTGYSLHGDFLNGWDGKILQKAIDECTAESGVIEECKVFDLYDYKDPANRCFQSAAIDETTAGTLPSLPGCNPISAGPQDVTVCAEKNPPAIKEQITISGRLAGGDHTLPVSAGSSASEPTAAVSSSDKATPSKTTATVSTTRDTATSSPSGTATDETEAEPPIGTAAIQSAEGSKPTPSTSSDIKPWWLASAVVALLLVGLALVIILRGQEVPAATPKQARGSVPAVVGSAPELSRHLLIHTPHPTSTWPSHLHATSPLAKHLHDRWQANPQLAKIGFNFTDGGDMKVTQAWDPSRTKFDEPPADAAVEEYSATVYPDFIDVPSASIAELSDERLASFSDLSPPPVSTPQNTTSTPSRVHIFICTHRTRDCRCGDIGEPLYDALLGEIKRRKLGGELKAGRDGVRIARVAHVGGHKWAGNALVYRSDGVGDWYGLLQPEDAPKLLDYATSPSSLPWFSRWRGRLGLTSDQVKAMYASRPAAEAEGKLDEPRQALGDSVEVVFRTFEGEERRVSGYEGESVMETARRHELPSILATCGGHCECATCHVLIPPSSASEEDAPPFPEMTDEEDEQLEFAIGATDDSRLACQLPVTKELGEWIKQGGRIQLPRY